MRMAIVEPVSLDSEVNGTSSIYAEIIADEKAHIPGKKLEDEGEKAMLLEVIGTLTSREKEVLYLRFGLNGHDPKNLEEVGKNRNITDERVRQLQNIAFAKLRRRIKSLKQNWYLEEYCKES